MISNCHILTAAHCVTYPREDYVKGIYVNAWRPLAANNTNGTTSKPFHISYILPQLTKVHERFSNRDNFNDVAILTMATCTDDFPVMELADSTFMESWPVETGTETRVAGFGRTSIQDPAVPEYLQTANVTYISREDCDRDYYPNKQPLKVDQFCAADTGRDSCMGDSGSPLYIEDSVSGKQKQLGIVSWGISCAVQEFPGVYASVPYHFEWIKQVCRYGLTNRDALSLCSSTTTVDTDAEVDRSALCLDVGQQCGSTNLEQCCEGSVCHHRDTVCKVPSREDTVSAFS